MGRRKKHPWCRFWHIGHKWFHFDGYRVCQRCSIVFVGSDFRGFRPPSADESWRPRER